MRLRPTRWLPARPWLGAQRVHIRPSRAGLAFAALLLALWIAAVNYRLGLGYALTYFAAACAIADMLFASRNLAGLSLAAAPGPAVFADGHALFTLRLINRSTRSRHAIRLATPASTAAPGLADIAVHGETAVSVALAAPQRGWQHAPPVRLSSSFPLGLFHAWCHWQPEARVLVYPQPEAAAPPLPVPAGTARQAAQPAPEGVLELAGVRAYQPGDPLQRLAWRHIARHDGEHLFSKQFQAAADAPAGAPPGQLMLDHADLHALAPEARLSRLTAWVLEAERRGVPYGLRLASLRIAPGLGASQRDACLRALALHAVPQDAARAQATMQPTARTTAQTAAQATAQTTTETAAQATAGTTAQPAVQVQAQPPLKFPATIKFPAPAQAALQATALETAPATAPTMPEPAARITPPPPAAREAPVTAPVQAAQPAQAVQAMQAMQAAQAALATQTAQPAQALQAALVAREAPVTERVQAAQPTQTARAAQAALATQTAQPAQTMQAAPAAWEAPVTAPAQAVQPAQAMQAAQAALATQTAQPAQAVPAALVAREAPVTKRVQAAQPAQAIQAAQAALATPAAREAPVTEPTQAAQATQATQAAP